MEKNFVLVVKAIYFDSQRCLTNHQLHQTDGITLYCTGLTDKDELHFSGFANSLTTVRQIAWHRDHFLQLECDFTIPVARGQYISMGIFTRVISPSAGLQDLLDHTPLKSVDWTPETVLAGHGEFNEKTSLLIKTQWTQRTDDHAWTLNSISCDIPKAIWNEQMDIICHRVDLMVATDKRKVLKV